MKKLCVVHISDIHLHGPNDKAIEYLDHLPASIEGDLKSAQHLIIIVSGDIAFSGKENEYHAALSALKKMESNLSKDGLKINWILTPGNHDGKFKDSSRSRLFAIDGILRENDAALDDSIVASCVEPQEEYFRFEAELNGGAPYVYKDPLLGIKTLEVLGKKLSFWEFNASWMSRVPEIQGDLVFPVAKYDAQLAEHVDFRFAVIHHPLNWYAQGTYHPFRQLLTKNFCAVFSGHEHVRNEHITKGIDDGFQCLFIEAGALGPHGATEVPSFSLITIDIPSGSFESVGLTYASTVNAFVKDSKTEYSAQFTLSSARDFEPTPALTEALEELGAPFSHPTRDTLRLSDVYIEPAFTSFALGDDDPIPVGITGVMNSMIENSHVVIRGDEHFGKSSLCSQLFYRVLKQELVPLRISARELSSGPEARRNRLVEDRVAEHYGHSAIGIYKALPLDSRVVIVDDFDKLGSNAEQYSRALEFMFKNFGKIVLTVGETFDVSLLGSTTVSEKLSEFMTFRMKGFSYAMRTELIQRWYALDLALDRISLETKVHDAQSRIDHAVAKALVPSTAFNTLMILQAMEATQKSQVVDAGVAQHYDMLIKRRLNDSGTAPKAIDGTYAYLSHLAWWQKKREVTTLDRHELDSFNENFRTAIHQVDTSSLIELLIRARILSVVDGMHQFRHPSARYFFLAHYIAEYSEDDREAKDFALSACRRLYKKDNANLIVFLASKVASRWIVKEVADVLSKLLRDIPLFNVHLDSKTLNGWVSETAKLAVDTTSDRDEQRRRTREREEEAQSIEDAQSDVSDVDDVSELDIFSQINLVFKTSEILGLILKSKFGSLDAALKNQLIQQLFDGPLRAISFFLGAINSQPEALVEYLSRNWEDKLPKFSLEQRTKLAQKFVYFSLGAYAQALLQRQGEIAGSPDLGIYVNNFIAATAKEEESLKAVSGTGLTYRLLAIATRLSYPADIPFSEIERLAKELKRNPFGFTLLQGLVGNHLYMFEVNYSGKQRLAAAVELDLRTQLIKDTVSQEGKTVLNRNFSRRNPQSLLARLTRSFMLNNERVMDIVEKKTRH